MESKTVSVQEAAEILRRYREAGYRQIFSVTFVKRTNGRVRKMTCRFGVRKYSKGGKMGYNPESRGLLPVCDVQLLAQTSHLPAARRPSPYRMINLQGLLEVRIDKHVYVIKQEAPPAVQQSSASV